MLYHGFQTPEADEGTRPTASCALICFSMSGIRDEALAQFSDILYEIYVLKYSLYHTFFKEHYPLLMW